MVYFVQKERADVIRMYEKQGTPPCGVFNAYIWNSCMDEIAGVITDIALLRVNELHFSTIPQEKLACAELCTISFEQTINIKIDGDTVYFTSAFFGEFVLHTCDQADAPGVEDAARLLVSCKLILTPGRHGLEVLQVSPTIRDEMVERPLLPLPTFPGVSANQYLLPNLSGINDATHQEALEQEAERFLMQYCREALECPKPVPIRKIAEDKMGLTLITDKSLSDDLGVFGETIFAESDVDVIAEDEPEKLHCAAGTVLLDPDVFMTRNIGSYNFTLAHEVYHWYAHRAYMLMRMQTQHIPAVQRCYVNGSGKHSPEELAEIQANAMAARILMPRKTVRIKYQEILQKYGTADEMVVADLAIFFAVSKQAMRIRLIELGLMDNSAPQQDMRRIDRLSLFEVFSADRNLRRLLVSGAYRYVDGYIVKNEPRYIEKNGIEVKLTEYAAAHLAECTIEFKAVQHHGETEDSLMQRYQCSELEADCENAFTEEELKQHRAGFEQFVKEESADDLAPPEKTFCELLVPHMTFETGTDFEAETGVKRTKLKQILDGEFNNPKVRTVVAICAGLNLDIVVTTELLRSAGHILLNTREHWAYKYIIVCGEGMLLDKRNSILIALGVAPLGSRMTGG